MLLLQETGGSGHMLKRQLMETAQPLAEQSFTIVSFSAVCMFYKHLYSFIDTAYIVCSGIFVMVYGVHLSGPSIDRISRVRQVCCCGPGGQEMLINCCTACTQQQL